MVFSSAMFLFVFLPAFLVGAVLTSRMGSFARNLNIVVFSLAFYVFGGGLYTVILIGSILFNWAYARFVLAHRSSPLRIGIGIAVNLIPLLLFKYLDFLLALSTDWFFKPFFALDLPMLKLFLPAGISFYTFQAISYLIDVHRRETGPEPSLLTFAAYKLFFPQLVAGPIVRYVEVKEKLSQSRITWDNLNAGIYLFGVGLAKKMLIADPVGRVVDQIYALDPSQLTTSLAWIGNIGYFLQIFFDFSGYSQMAIGLGLMVGFQFPDNFHQPYRSQSITEFWRRWHMTLSRWFRDYLYVPLGGNRKGAARTLINLWVVFLLCGLWHGAALTFLVWGAYHGTLLVIERVAKRSFGFEPKGLAGVILTTVLVIVGWVFFRSKDLAQAQTMLTAMFGFAGDAHSMLDWQFYLTPYVSTLFVIGLVIAWLPIDTTRARERLQGGFASGAAVFGTLLTMASVAELASSGFNPFIYFQF